MHQPNLEEFHIFSNEFLQYRDAVVQFLTKSLLENFILFIVLIMMITFTIWAAKNLITKQIRKILVLTEKQEQIITLCNSLWERVDAIERKYRKIDLEHPLPSFILPYVDISESIEDFRRDYKLINGQCPRSARMSTVDDITEIVNEN